MKPETIAWGDLGGAQSQDLVAGVQAAPNEPEHVGYRGFDAKESASGG